jgi:hypothetical protein
LSALGKEEPPLENVAKRYGIGHRVGRLRRVGCRRRYYTPPYANANDNAAFVAEQQLAATDAASNVF